MIEQTPKLTIVLLAIRHPTGLRADDVLKKDYVTGILFDRELCSHIYKSGNDSTNLKN
jgi:hypothetical protein